MSNTPYRLMTPAKAKSVAAVLNNSAAANGEHDWAYVVVHCGADAAGRITALIEVRHEGDFVCYYR